MNHFMILIEHLLCASHYPRYWLHSSEQNSCPQGRVVKWCRYFLGPCPSQPICDVRSCPLMHTQLLDNGDSGQGLRWPTQTISSGNGPSWVSGCEPEGVGLPVEVTSLKEGGVSGFC